MGNFWKGFSEGQAAGQKVVDAMNKRALADQMRQINNDGEYQSYSQDDLNSINNSDPNSDKQWVSTNSDDNPLGIGGGSGYWKDKDGNQYVPQNTPTVDSKGAYSLGDGKTVSPSVFRLGNQSQSTHFSPEEIQAYRMEKAAQVMDNMGDPDKAMAYRVQAMQLQNLGLQTKAAKAALDQQKKMDDIGDEITTLRKEHAGLDYSDPEAVHKFYSKLGYDYNTMPEHADGKYFATSVSPNGEVMGAIHNQSTGVPITGPSPVNRELGDRAIAAMAMQRYAAADPKFAAQLYASNQSQDQFNKTFGLDTTKVNDARNYQRDDIALKNKVADNDYSIKNREVAVKELLAPLEGDYYKAHAAYMGAMTWAKGQSQAVMKALEPLKTEFEALSPEDQAGAKGQGIMSRMVVTAATKSGDVTGMINSMTNTSYKNAAIRESVEKDVDKYLENHPAPAGVDADAYRDRLINQRLIRDGLNKDVPKDNPVKGAYGDTGASDKPKLGNNATELPKTSEDIAKASLAPGETLLSAEPVRVNRGQRGLKVTYKKQVTGRGGSSEYTDTKIITE